MRIVLDTNVLIAAFISRSGACARLLDHCARNHTIVCSEFILGELSDKLSGKFQWSAEVVAEAIDLIRPRLEVVVPAPLEAAVCRDPEDDQVLGTAVAGNAEYLVTGDKDLLVLGQHQGIRIVRPADFPLGPPSPGNGNPAE